MNLSIILTLLKLALWVVQSLERAKLKAEGKAEAHAESKEVHDARVVKADAARDAVTGLPADSVQHDPFNRDNR